MSTRSLSVFLCLVVLGCGFNRPALKQVPVQTPPLNFIIYVADQQRSARFYAAVLGRAPELDVPGMTQFRLRDDCVLGLMPEAGIRRLLGTTLPDPAGANGIPRAEIYLPVDDPAAFHRRALEAGGRELSPLLERDWGDLAAYSLDPDGHVLAFAKPAR